MHGDCSGSWLVETLVLRVCGLGADVETGVAAPEIAFVM